MFGRKGKSDYFFGGMLIIASILVFAIPFGLSPILVADSPAYMSGRLNEGIVPFYPLFICLNKFIFTQDYYLQAVVLEQIAFAAFCTDLFLLFIKRTMNLRWIETYIFLLFTMVPYTVFMPIGMTSRHIATEALAYPCFYLLMVFILKGIWTNNFFSILIADIIAILMALTRTQLQIVLLLPIGAFFLLWLRGFAWNEKMKKPYRIVSGALLSCVIFVLSYGVFRQSNLFLQSALLSTANAVESKSDNQENLEDSVIASGVEENYVEEVAAESENKEEAATESENKEAAPDSFSNNHNIASQFSTVMFVKVMIVADKSDANLFQDTNMQQAYAYVCDRMEQEQWSLSSMDKDLLIGDRIQGSLVNVLNVDMYLNDFIVEYPDSGIDISAAKTEFVSVLLRAHPFRWMLSGILQFPSGLISTVFVHRKNMYWFSYLVTAGLYALAVWMCVARRKDVRRRDFMMTSICVNMLFVVATSMVFVSFKRYVNYGFGMFYISLYCIAKEYTVDFIKKHYDKAGVTS